LSRISKRCRLLKEAVRDESCSGGVIATDFIGADRRRLITGLIIDVVGVLTIMVISFDEGHLTLQGINAIQQFCY
jgi:hypothetical protein